MRRALRLTKRTRAESLTRGNSRFRFRAGTFRNAIAVHQFHTAQFARKEMTMINFEEMMEWLREERRAEEKGK
jgi:hypothetical protein